MQLDPVTGPAGSTPAGPATGNKLDKNAFLKLLVTQLRNQDPSNAGDSKEMIAQLAQFSALEQSQQQSANLTQMLQLQQLTQGSALIGRKVLVADPESGNVTQGAVSGLHFVQGKPEVVVDGQGYELSTIQSVE